MDTQKLALLCAAILMVVIMFAIMITFVAMFRPWMQSFLSGTPVPLFKILAMRLRGAPVKKILDQRIKANYVGVDLAVEQLEHAYRQGADIEKLVDALCLARRSDRGVTWDELLQTELTG